jgi:hypothetical protein
MPPLLEFYRFDAAPGRPHPLLDSAALQEVLPFLKPDEATVILQVVQSCTRRLHGSLQSPASDDAVTNPFYRTCPSPRHRERGMYMRQALFLHAAEKRLEWREVFGIPDLPVQWYGCSPGCLEFLANDEWDLSSEFGDAW